MLLELAPGVFALTGVIAHVGVGGQSADVVRVDHVGVPLPAVTGVMEDVVERRRRYVLTHDPHLRHKHKLSEIWGRLKSEVFTLSLG